MKPGTATLLLDLWRWIVDSFSGDPFAHAANHRPDSSVDPLATAAPSNPTGTAAAVGSAGTVLRSDSVTKQGIVVARGQLLGHNASVPAPVPAPSASALVLTSDLTQATYVKWAAPAGGAAATLTSAQQEQADFELGTAFESLAMRDVMARTFR